MFSLKKGNYLAYPRITQINTDLERILLEIQVKSFLLVSELVKISEN